VVEETKMSVDGDYFLNLSFCQFKKEEKNYISPEYFDIEEKNPRLGPIFSSGKPFKSSFFGIKEGSIFKTKEKKPFFGQVNPNLYPKRQKFFPIQVLFCLPYYFSI